MVLVNEHHEEAFTMLNNSLAECVDTQAIIVIHENSKNRTMRNSVVLEEFDLTDSSLYISGGWFQEEIKNIANIQYAEEEQCFYVTSEDGDLFILELGE